MFNYGKTSRNCVSPRKPQRILCITSNHYKIYYKYFLHLWLINHTRNLKKICRVLTDTFKASLISVNLETIELKVRSSLDFFFQTHFFLFFLYNGKYDRDDHLCNWLLRKDCKKKICYCITAWSPDFNLYYCPPRATYMLAAGCIWRKLWMTGQCRN